MRLVIAAVLVVGCGGSSGMMEPDDAGEPPPVATFPSMITIGAADGMVAAGFSATVNGTAQAPLGQIAITGGTGTFQDVDSTSAFLYATVPFVGYTLYQGFGVSPTRWDVFWLYCLPAGLNNVYTEGVSGAALFNVAATGTCADAGNAPAHVTLPAFQLPAPTPLAGYTVTGKDITVANDGTGSVTVSGTTMPLRVFGDVDCSACGTPGWRELHSVIWDDATQHVIFTIIYLMDAGSVEITYARSLPDLGDPIGTEILPATWTTPSAVRTGERRHIGMPPPSALGR